MPGIEACSVRTANFLYITDSMWKHAPRVEDSPNNLIFVTEGVLFIEMQGIRYTVKPGECLFLPQGVLSRGYRPSAVSTGFFFVRFNADKIGAAPVHFPVPDPAPVRELFAQLVKASYHSAYPRAGLDALLHALFYTLQFQHSGLARKPDDSLAERIKEYVVDSCFRNLTVRDVAVHFGLCPDHVNRVFSAAEHITLKAYINQLKISRIEEYLISTNTPIKEIAEKMHFSTLSAMSKFYKYHTGRTPEEYRKQFARVIGKIREK